MKITDKKRLEFSTEGRTINEIPEQEINDFIPKMYASELFSGGIEKHYDFILKEWLCISAKESLLTLLTLNGIKEDAKFIFRQD